MVRRFINKRSHFKKYFLIYLLIVFAVIGVAYSSFSTNFQIGGTISLAKYQIKATITLNSTGATTPGTTKIYEVASLGFFLDSSYQNEMTTSSNPITVPTKTGYNFIGYYTEPNGEGVEYIDSLGRLTSNADNTYFTSDGTLYAFFSKELYGILKRESDIGTYAIKYTGEHQDSYEGTGTKNIYHWYADNDTDGTAIQDKNNVIFAGHCWKMIRTTDTGGIKMIYNGEVNNNQCLNTRGTHIGYGSRTYQNMVGNYYYGTSYNFDSINNVFSLSGTLTQNTWNATTGPTLVGKYTCKQTTESGTCASLYLVESYYNTSSGYVIPISNNSHYSQFGTLQYNANNNSPSYVGYMYNEVYPYQFKPLTISEEMLTDVSLSTSYWYATNVAWGSPTAYNYNLVNPYQVSSTTDYSNLVGKYTFRNTSKNYVNKVVYYIAAVDGSTMYSIKLNDTGNHTLSDFNHTYTYGDSYTDNGNGTYTINNPSTIQRKDWYTGYSNVGAGKYVCKNATNNTCSELLYTTPVDYSFRNTYIEYEKPVNVYKYAKRFIWNGSKYVLDNNTSVSFWDISNNTNQTSLDNAHYTCWNATGECTSVSYIYYYDINNNSSYYINLTNGESIEDAKNKMLYNNDVNAKNSTIKTGIDAWYAKYLSSYDSYLEDTIFCNDRSQSNADINGWNPNGKILSGDSIYLLFKEYNATSDLNCINETDRFSTLNPKARLTYKVGLMSSPEINILNNNNARVTGQVYWLASPVNFKNSFGLIRFVNASGIIFRSGDVDYSRGVRPAISLKPGTTYLSGNGSMTSPYKVN